MTRNRWIAAALAAAAVIALVVFKPWQYLNTADSTPPADARTLTVSGGAVDTYVLGTTYTFTETKSIAQERMPKAGYVVWQHERETGNGSVIYIDFAQIDGSGLNFKHTATDLQVQFVETETDAIALSAAWTETMLREYANSNTTLVVGTNPAGEKVDNRDGDADPKK